jgi:hypothetical protein
MLTPQELAKRSARNMGRLLAEQLKARNAGDWTTITEIVTKLNAIHGTIQERNQVTNHTPRPRGGVTWTREKLERFKRALKLADARPVRDATFEFEGHVFVPNYARYLVEYLESRV